MQTTQSPKAGERTQIERTPEDTKQFREFLAKQSTQAHSPGTWEVCWNPYRHEYGAIGIWNGAYSVAHAMPCNQIEANARLIAAAPKMAALLRKIYDSPKSGEMEAWALRDIQDCLTEAGLTK